MVKGTSSSENLYDNLILELRRGVLVLVVLGQLREEQYGYSLQKSLAEQGFDVDQGTLYPLLRRLEAQTLLQSRWNVEGARPRRYYSISPDGEQILHRLLDEWRALVAVTEQLVP